LNAPRKQRHKDRPPGKGERRPPHDRAPEPSPAEPARRELPPRRQGKLPAERLPVILEVEPNDDYALLDSGDGRKLERYGPYRIVRPEGRRSGARPCPSTNGRKATPSSPATPTRKAWAAGAFPRRRSARPGP
jgi:23S rRNA (cytosine1962-C5)-methyltransferase